VSKVLIFKKPVIHFSEIASENKLLRLTSILNMVAAAMLPFYKRVAESQAFANKWSKAVVSADLHALQKMLSQTVPAISTNELGTNAIGYFIGFEKFNMLYTNGTTIPPGIVQFMFEPRAHRALACTVLPFYKELANNKHYAHRVAAAILNKKSLQLNRLVRSKVKCTSLKSVALETEGVSMLFRFPFSKYPYRNLLIREMFNERRVKKRYPVLHTEE